MREYKIAKVWAILIYVIAPLMIGLFGWALILPFLEGDFSPNAMWVLIPVSLTMITLMVIGMIDTYKSRLIIGNDKIISKSAFSIRMLAFDEIKGYTVNEKHIVLEPVDKQKKRIKISIYTGGYDEIHQWLSQTFPDIDQQTALEEERDILNDEKLGWRQEIREEKLLRARKISKTLNWAAGIAAAWFFFYPTPYQYVALAAMLIPIAALLVVRFSNGLIRFDEKKGSAYPSVVQAFIYPSLALMIRAIIDYNIFDYSNIWIAATGITVLFLLLLLVKQKQVTFKKSHDYVVALSIALFLFAYSYGAVVHINCDYDDSETQCFTSEVINMRVSSGKTTSYFLELSPWGEQTDADEVSVDKELYNRTQAGDSINIYLCSGKLDIEWFIVSDE